METSFFWLHHNKIRMSYALRPHYPIMQSRIWTQLYYCPEFSPTDTATGGKLKELNRSQSWLRMNLRGYLFS